MPDTQDKHASYRSLFIIDQWYWQLGYWKALLLTRTSIESIVMKYILSFNVNMYIDNVTCVMEIMLNILHVFSFLKKNLTIDKLSHSSLVHICNCAKISSAFWKMYFGSAISFCIICLSKWTNIPLRFLTKVYCQY